MFKIYLTYLILLSFACTRSKARDEDAPIIEGGKSFKGGVFYNLQNEEFTISDAGVVWYVRVDLLRDSTTFCQPNKSSEAGTLRWDSVYEYTLDINNPNPQSSVDIKVDAQNFPHYDQLVCDGNYSYSVMAHDQKNQGNKSFTFPFGIDRSPPKLKIDNVDVMNEATIPTKIIPTDLSSAISIKFDLSEDGPAFFDSSLDLNGDLVPDMSEIHLMDNNTEIPRSAYDLVPIISEDKDRKSVV